MATKRFYALKKTIRNKYTPENRTKSYICVIDFKHLKVHPITGHHAYRNY